MRKISTLTYIIKTYGNNVSKEELFCDEFFSGLNDDRYEPASESIDAILSFAQSYDVMKAQSTGNIEINLN